MQFDGIRQSRADGDLDVRRHFDRRGLLGSHVFLDDRLLFGRDYHVLCGG
jgi:hypothetical protein